jgi:hypothetical protein
MAEERDFMAQVVDEYRSSMGDEPQAEPAEAPQDVGTPDVPPVVPVIEPQAAPVQTPQYDFMKEFNSKTGLNFDTEDKLKAFAELYNKAPEIEEKSKIIPELVDALEKLQNPLNYFKDEVAYKVAQITKETKYTGKENIVETILRNDLDKLGDLKVIELASQLKAKEGVRNPLRAELRGMNIDPDMVLEDYDSLDDDTKDLLKIKADQYREDLPKIGEGVKAPSFEGTAVERLISQKKAQQEDYASRMGKTMPIAQNIITEIKELKVADDFAFKLDMTSEEIKSYSESLAEILVSGQYDIGTEAGKKEIYSAIMDMLKADYFDKAVAAYASMNRTKVEEEMRRKYNNEVPLKKSEPDALADTDGKDIITRAAELMVSRGW